MIRMTRLVMVAQLKNTNLLTVSSWYTLFAAAMFLGDDWLKCGQSFNVSSASLNELTKT